jgi:quercetin dioxygenase-like cupin family protein
VPRKFVNVVDEWTQLLLRFVNQVDERNRTMGIIRVPASPTHDLGSTRFTSLATPSSGSTETSVWFVEIDPGTPATPHSLTREEVFVVLEGSAMVTLSGEGGQAVAGDAFVVPPDVPFEVANDGDGPLKMLCCLPVGGQACVDGAAFTPPWAQ